MKRKLAILLSVILVAALFAGCAGTTVVINECDCEVHDQGAADEVVTPVPELPEGALKTGLAVLTDITGSTSASEQENGAAEYEITLAAVTVDDDGVIHSCKLDVVPATINMDAAGVITTDLSAEVLTKNEQGDDYGMVAWGGAVAEWYEQADALCQFAVGKTVDQLLNGAVDESGKAPAGSDLASSATIYLGGYVNAIAAAVDNARHLGAQSGDVLALSSVSTLENSSSATAEAEGTAQLYTTAAAVTSKDGVITSCAIDAVQANVNFDTTGTITTDLEVEVLTKNQLGDDYGMTAWGGAIAEWYEQAASFAAYTTGKTADEVAGIAIDEAAKPAADSDLASSVTISVGDFMSLIEKIFA